MKRYIEQDAVEKMLEDAQLISDGEFCGYCTEDVNLDSIPAAYVVEVVRCRECEQGGKSANFPGMVYCKNTRTYTNPDDFCSRGKKEETE